MLGAVRSRGTRRAVANPYRIDITRTACGHVAAFRKYDRNRILDAIKEQLRHNPTVETRNRKILRDNPLSDWELRVDPFRVFYEADEQTRTVRVVAVGVKDRTRLFIDGEEIQI